MLASSHVALFIVTEGRWLKGATQADAADALALAPTRPAPEIMHLTARCEGHRVVHIVAVLPTDAEILGGSAEGRAVSKDMRSNHSELSSA
jgi:hypothetical protein